ncbi:MAG TPA: hypothetical protein VGJ55_18300 [Pyrinomonadaceae bacterium]|jgi:hypothetical protein
MKSAMKLTKITYRLLLILVVAVVPAGIDRITTQAISASCANPIPEVSSTSSGHVSVSPKATGTQTGERFEVELVTLLPTGFEPAEITRPAGPFLLGVNNRTGLQELSLQVVDETGITVVARRMIKVKTWRKVINLLPGHYVLRETGHPEWLCRITIIP